ncbi:MAG: WecB/TagA/CpsF family glycosyltransferase [Rhodothermales bacterium]|nr:WecB/TagA/CpsF family glycosyltransferase [Rhodothermales bacterium]
MSRARVISFEVDALDYGRAVDRVLNRLDAGQSGYVCVANVHMVMEAHDDPAFARVVQNASVVTSDGMPLVWMLKAQGLTDAERVYGPTLTLELCRAAADHGLPIGLYGGTEESLESFKAVLADQFPALRVACAISPPFRPLTPEEDAEYTQRLRASGARIIFVGIGCPRQEKWMAAHTGQLPGAMLLGVGAAFDFHSGRVRQAPALLQRAGLEWAFRLAMEPRRLWRRYVIHNPRFVLLAGRQLLGQWWPAKRTGTESGTARSGRHPRSADRVPNAPDRKHSARILQGKSHE